MAEKLLPLEIGCLLIQFMYYTFGRTGLFVVTGCLNWDLRYVKV